MKQVLRIAALLFVLTLLLCSCHAPADTMSAYTPPALSEEEIHACQLDGMKTGGVYFHDDHELYNLMELEYIYPIGCPDYDRDLPGLGFEETYEQVLNDPNYCIVTITVMGYTQQINKGELISTSTGFDSDLYTNCRIDTIYHEGKGVDLKAGNTYQLKQNGIWVWKDGDTSAYSVSPWYGDYDDIGALRYGHRYLVCVMLRPDLGNQLQLVDTLRITELCTYDVYQQIVENHHKLLGSRSEELLRLYEPEYCKDEQE